MSVLRAILVAGVLAALPMVAAGQGTVPAGQQAAVTSVIRGQMDAFLHDDGVRAFSYASPRIKEKFQAPDIFMSMVRGGYAAVYRPRDVEFLDPIMDGGDIMQPVRVTGPDGESVIALYRMQRQPGGSWKIGGVTILRTGEVTS